MSWLFSTCGQSIGTSVSTIVLPMNIQGWFPLGLFGLISLLSKGLSRVLQHQILKASILWCSGFFKVQLSHLYMATGKTIALTRWTFVSKATSLLLSALSRFVITFLPKSKSVLISWLQSQSTGILDPRKIKSVIFFCFFPFYLPWSDGTGYHDLSFLNVEF